jgi:rare lipoprotein A
VAGNAARTAAALLTLALALGACATRQGHYYADDGPPERVPPNLDSVPDAVARIEPLRPHANRPYTALGRTYTPDTGDAPFEQRGIASWYGRQFHGNRTASGEPYDMFAMSAAHPTLPIPSYARVTNARDGRSVIVRINDRGPFLHDRVIDLSYAAAARLGIAGPGSGDVIVRKITARDIAAGRHAAGALAATAPVAAPLASAVAAPLMAPPLSLPLSPLSALQVPPPTGTEARVPLGAPGWSVQLGAFGVPDNAAALRDRIALLLATPEADMLPAAARTPRIEQDGRLSRVLIGRYGDRSSAQAWAQTIGGFLMRKTTLYLH